MGELVGVGLRLGVGDLLGVGDGLGVALDGAPGGWLGVGDGVAADEPVGVGEGTDVLGGVGELLARAATCPACVDAAAIMIPATIATMPPTAPAASPERSRSRPDESRARHLSPGRLLGAGLGRRHRFPACGGGVLPREEYRACPPASPTKQGRVAGEQREGDVHPARW